MTSVACTILGVLALALGTQADTGLGFLVGLLVGALMLLWAEVSRRANRPW